MSKSNYAGQEKETLREGHEAATRESVKDAVENTKAQDAAKAKRFATTGEPNEAPRLT